MAAHVTQLLTAESQAAFYADDRVAIQARARRDGSTYVGPPMTSGYRAIRQPGEALSVLVLSDGQVAHGDWVSVQYSGVARRQSPFSAQRARRLVEHVVAPAIVGQPVESFRTTAGALAELPTGPAVACGVSQALLHAAPLATGRTAAELIAEAYDTGVALCPVAIIAQTAEEPLRRGRDDPQGRRRPTPWPAQPRVGARRQRRAVAGRLRRWVSERVRALRPYPDHRPVLHFHTYGAPGAVFRAPASLASYLARLAEAATCFACASSTRSTPAIAPRQIATPAGVAGRVAPDRRGRRGRGREWCNVLGDVQDFVAAGAADMIHVKAADLGSLDQTMLALRHCAEHRVKRCCGEAAARPCAARSSACTWRWHAAPIKCRPNRARGTDAALSAVRTEIALVPALATREDKET